MGTITTRSIMNIIMPGSTENTGIISATMIISIMTGGIVNIITTITTDLNRQHCSHTTKSDGAGTNLRRFYFDRARAAWIANLYPCPYPVKP